MRSLKFRRWGEEKVPTEILFLIESCVINSTREPFPFVPPIRMISLGFLSSKSFKAFLNSVKFFLL